MRFTSSSDGRGPALDARLAQWADRIGKIRRIWLTENARVVVALELQPVADSEESLPLRIAHGGEWQRELEALIGRPIELEWLDADDATRSESGSLLYERAA